MGSYFFILILLALLWFLLIRPQRRRQMESQRMIESLQTGKEIVTAGGLYGTITEVHEDEVRVEVADGVEVRIAKRAVAAVLSEEEEEETEEPEEGDEGDLVDEANGTAETRQEEAPATLRE